mmetsp:Transcript_6978/g.8409  ORF Transcript_6978/g.8409 Transcript_6978/m.8409 type:complete len:94 (-) Transcript_6978:602-883(-)
MTASREDCVDEDGWWTQNDSTRTTIIFDAPKCPISTELTFSSTSMALSLRKMLFKEGNWQMSGSAGAKFSPDESEWTCRAGADLSGKDLGGAD